MNLGNCDTYNQERKSADGVAVLVVNVSFWGKIRSLHCERIFPGKQSDHQWEAAA